MFNRKGVVKYLRGRFPAVWVRYFSCLKVHHWHR